MGESDVSITGDPNDPISYLREFLRGEISYNPRTLSEVYMKLAEDSDGPEQLAYSALAWAVSDQSLARINALMREVRQLKDRVETLEQQSGQ